MKYIYPVLTALGLLAIPISIQITSDYEMTMRVWFIATIVLAVCGTQTILKTFRYRGNYALISLVILCIALAGCIIGILLPNLVSISNGFFIVWSVSAFLGGMVIFLILHGIISLFHRIKN